MVDLRHTVVTGAGCGSGAATFLAICNAVDYLREHHSEREDDGVLAA